jgi:hypothetical protein
LCELETEKTTICNSPLEIPGKGSRKYLCMLECSIFLKNLKIKKNCAQSVI